MLQGVNWLISRIAQSALFTSLTSTAAHELSSEANMITYYAESFDIMMRYFLSDAPYSLHFYEKIKDLFELGHWVGFYWLKVNPYLFLMLLNIAALGLILRFAFSKMEA